MPNTQQLVLLPLLLAALASICAATEIKVTPGPEGQVGVFPFDKDGHVDPALNEQRFRYAEYHAEDPFYQWYYFCIKDLDLNRYFFMFYYWTTSPQGKTSPRDGGYIGAGAVDHKTGKTWQKWEKYDKTDFQWTGNMNLNVASGGDGGVAGSIAAQDGGHVHITGRLGNADRVWYAHGIDRSAPVTWDLKLTRIFGWYGQPDLERWTKLSRVISWNTYAHTASVEGTVVVAEESVPFETSPRYRAYQDMNWGAYFPHGDPPKEHPWGWYSIVVPNADPNKEIGIVAGSGFLHMEIPHFWNPDGLGMFSDMRVGSGLHVGARRLTAVKGFMNWWTTNDGRMHHFDVKRSNWATYSDELGSADIPLSQSWVTETDHYRMELEFTSKMSDYNRLLCPHPDYVFSDFEALGVHVAVNVTDPKHGYAPLYQFEVDDGGLEFGYRVDVKPWTRADQAVADKDSTRQFFFADFADA